MADYHSQPNAAHSRNYFPLTENSPPEAPAFSINLRVMGQPMQASRASAAQPSLDQTAGLKTSVVTSPHSGHFMTSNLEDDDDYVDGLGRGLGVEGPDPTSIIPLEFPQTPKQKEGYDFEKVCKTPKDTYRFSSTNNKHYVKDFDSSLSKLFACMSLAYSGKLTTPKFKAFKGLKINVWDKMRLNNIIWREWHLQFVQKHKPAVCSFTIHMDDTHTRPESVVLEGKYWKRKLDIVCVEYQKWRVFYKKKIMPKSQEIQELLDRVANRSSHSHTLFAAQNHDPVRLLDDDFSMDFSDTLFSTLIQNTPQSSDPDNYYGHANADFIQPNLIGLQPTLDDFGNMDTMEPFQDLLSEALSGWSTPAPVQTFGGSLNNVSVYDPSNPAGQGALFGGPPLTASTLYSSYNSLSPQIEAAIPSTLTHTGSEISQAPTPPSYVYINQSQASTSHNVNQWHNRPILLQQAQIPPGISHSTGSGTNSTRAKVVTRTPRSIAPKSRPSLPASPFLAQLLTKNQQSGNLNTFGTGLHAGMGGAAPHTSTASNSKTIVPDLVALSGNSGSLNNASGLTSPQGSLNDDASNSPQSAEDIFSTPRTPDERRDSAQGISSADHKRRSHIKHGFEALQTLVPALSNSPSSKISKAAMLSKTAEFAGKLKAERQQMQEESDLLQHEIEALSSAISACQCQLPATGVPVTRQHSDQMKMMLQAYIKERTLQNWKFYIFSQLATPLFDSFNTMVSTANIDELYRTSQTWLDQHCALPALRPAVLSSLRTIGTETSILSEPEKFPEQAQAAVNHSLTPSASSAASASTSSCPRSTAPSLSPHSSPYTSDLAPGPAPGPALHPS